MKLSKEHVMAVKGMARRSTSVRQLAGQLGVAEGGPIPRKSIIAFGGRGRARARERPARLSGRLAEGGLIEREYRR